MTFSSFPSQPKRQAQLKVVGRSWTTTADIISFSSTTGRCEILCPREHYYVDQGLWMVRGSR